MIISKLKKEITSSDYIFKDVVVCGKKVNLIFNEVLTDSGSINEFLYYLLTKVSKSDLQKFNFKIPNSNSIIIKYDDIINLPHHVSKNHKQMLRINRAAQFAPFSALTGYEEAINETKRIVEEKKIISNQIKQEINDKLIYINNHLKENIYINIVYFIKDKNKNGGIYVNKLDYVKKIDNYKHELILNNNERILFDDIYSLEYEN